jgi:protocatechuate 3,4-dioxygenase beta subunit
MHTSDPRSPSHPRMPERLLTRRGSLLRFGGLLAGFAAVGGWKIGTSAGAGAGPAGVASGKVRCLLTPELTEGPYYIPHERVRRNITEGRAGTPLTLQLSVLDASTCRPIAGAAVDIWHADAGGTYSGEPALGTAGKTFMRGIQRTNAHGIATFQTVYPGWYMGRAVHIHVKVHIAGNVVHTGQLFFRDSVTDTVYKRSPYNRRPNRDTRNATDSIYRNGGSKSVLSVRRRGAGYLGTIAMGVHRT